MVRRDIIVVGASAGGVEALSCLVSDLFADLPESPDEDPEALLGEEGATG